MNPFESCGFHPRVTLIGKSTVNDFLYGLALARCNASLQSCPCRDQYMYRISPTNTPGHCSDPNALLSQFRTTDNFSFSPWWCGFFKQRMIHWDRSLSDANRCHPSEPKELELISSSFSHRIGTMAWSAYRYRQLRTPYIHVHPLTDQALADFAQSVTMHKVQSISFPI